MENILVAGANGTTGKIIVALLKDSNAYNPIAMVRKEEQLVYFRDQNIATFLGDLESDYNLESAQHIDKVIFAAGSGGKNVIGVDQEGAKKLMDVSKKVGISKFIMLSSMGADHPDEATQLQEYLKAKHNADEYLKSSGLNYCIVRPGTLINDPATELIEIATKLGKHGEISRADVASTLVESLNNNVSSNVIFEIIKGSVPIKQALQTV